MTASQLLVPTYAQAPFQPVRAAGSRVWDAEGQDYLDLAGGIAVCSMGHCHPELIQVLQQQAQQLWHISNFYASPPTLALAQALTEATFAESVFFTNSGTEAVEAAIKMARRYAWQRGENARNRILCFSGAFHGRTSLAIALGGNEAHRTGFQPLPDGIERCAYNDTAALKKAIHSHLAAVLIEPVQGEAGVLAANPEFLRAVREICDSTGTLLIYDEVQSGIGRTGPLFSYMQSDVVPDILLTAKGLGGGLPIGALLTRREIAECMKAGTHGSTFGGNPIICAVALKVLELVQSQKTTDNIAARSTQLADGLHQISGNRKFFSEIRVQGMWAGCTLADEWAGRGAELLDECWRSGVFALPAAGGNLRLAPALNITEAELSEGLERLHTACNAFFSRPKI